MRTWALKFKSSAPLRWDAQTNQATAKNFGSTDGYGVVRRWWGQRKFVETYVFSVQKMAMAMAIEVIYPSKLTPTQCDSSAAGSFCQIQYYMILGEIQSSRRVGRNLNTKFIRQADKSQRKIPTLNGWPIDRKLKASPLCDLWKDGNYCKEYIKWDDRGRQL